MSIAELVAAIGQELATQVVAYLFAEAAISAQPTRSLIERPDAILSAARVLLRKLETRDMHIWWARTISLRRPTLETLARRFGITRARAQQIEARASRKVKHELAGLAIGPVGVAALELRQELGAAYPISFLRRPYLGLAAEIAAGEGLVSDPIAASELGSLLLYLAGPYRIENGWLALTDYAPFDEAERAAQDDDGEPVEVQVAVDRLTRTGVGASAGERLLRDTTTLKIIDGFVCEWPPDTTARAALVLRLAGHPLTKREIARRVEKQFGTVGNALAASPAFVRLDVDSYGLAEWGGDRYDGIVDEMKDAIRARGGIASVEQIMSDVTGRYSVSPASIRTYVASHQFVRVGPGLYRVRGSAEAVPSTTRSRLEDSQSCFVVASHWALRLEINAERLRGSGIGIPTAFSFHVGVPPAGKLEVPVVSGANRKALGYIRFGWPKNMPTIGSVADITMQLRLRPGDYLFLGWDTDKERLVAHGTSVAGTTELSESATRARIAALIGIAQAPDSTTELLRLLAVALDLGDNAGRGAVIGRLSSRNDRELINLSRVLFDLVAIRIDSKAAR